MKTLSVWRFVGAVLLVLGVLSVPIIQAQTVQGTVVGTITDASGAVLPKALVNLTNDDTNVVQTTESDNAGNYRFSLVPPGKYTLSVKAPGFNEKQIKGIVVEASTA